MLGYFNEKLEQIKKQETTPLDMKFVSNNNNIQQLINSIQSVTKINKQIFQIGSVNESNI